MQQTEALPKPGNEPAPEDIMEVEGREQLAAAIRGLPHDKPCRIILHHGTGKTTYDFPNNNPHDPRNVLYRGDHYKRLADRVLKMQAELFK